MALELLYSLLENQTEYEAPDRVLDITSAHLQLINALDAETPEDDAFPTFLPFLYIHMELLDSRAGEGHPLGFKRLTGRTPKAYAQALARTSATGFTKLRKDLKRFTGDKSEHFQILTHLLRHRRRMNMLEAWLEGNDVPVLEHDILSQWASEHGVELPRPEQIVINPAAMVGRRSPARVLEHERYCHLTVPVLSAVQAITPEENAKPTIRTWLTFNAWFAIASLSGSIRTIIDCRQFWQCGHDVLLLLTGPDQGRRLIDMSTGLMPLVPSRQINRFDSLRKHASWIASQDNLLNKWNEIGPRLVDMQTEWEILHNDQAPFIQLIQQNTFAEITIRYSPQNSTNGEWATWLESLIERMDDLCTDETREVISTVTDSIAGYQHHVERLLMGLVDDLHCLVLLEPDQSPPEHVSPEMLARMPLFPPHLIDALSEVVSYVRRTEAMLGDWKNTMTELMSNHSLGMGEQMRQLQQYHSQFNAWAAESVAEMQSSFIPTLASVDWDNIVSLPTTSPQPQENEPDPDTVATEQEERLAELQRRLTDLEQQLAQRDDRLAQSEQENLSLRHHLNEASHASPAVPVSSTSPALLEALNTFAETTNSSQALALALAAYPDRLRILDSALASARDADSQLSGTGLLRKLMALATHGWDMMQSGKPAYDLHGVVPGELALNESESVSNDPRLRKERSFTEKRPEGDVKWQMSWHLSLDNRHRLHFAWDADASQFVIGHAGRHLPIASIA